MDTVVGVVVVVTVDTVVGVVGVVGVTQLLLIFYPLYTPKPHLSRYFMCQAVLPRAGRGGPD